MTFGMSSNNCVVNRLFITYKKAAYKLLKWKYLMHLEANIFQMLSAQLYNEQG